MTLQLISHQSKLSLTDDTSPTGESAKSKLKLGLFSYPVLQAADILVHRYSFSIPHSTIDFSSDLGYRATHVPVGEDQSQHLEFARECVTNFNHAYGPHLIAPKTIMCMCSSLLYGVKNTNSVQATAKRVMSLQEPHLKMSKSHADPRSRILITDTPEVIYKKLMAALTDSTNSISYDPENRPGVSNLLELLSHFDAGGRDAQELADVYGDLGLGQFKKVVATAISESLAGVRDKYHQVLNQDGGAYLDHVEREGARKARESANATMAIVREAVGLSDHSVL